MSPLWAANSSARACSLVSNQDHEIGGCDETARNEELAADCLLLEGTVDLALEVPGPCLSGEHRWHVSSFYYRIS